MNDPSPDYWKHSFESLLENESLTADLDDEAAQALLDWGFANLRHIQAEHFDLPQEQVEEDTYGLQRLNRKLLRRVNRWAARRAQYSGQENADMLSQVLELAAELHPGHPTSDPHKQAEFLASSEQAPPSEFIRLLQAFIENQ